MSGLGGQLRVSMGRPFALDYGTALAMGQAVGADMGLLADVLPVVEVAILDREAGDEVDFGD